MCSRRCYTPSDYCKMWSDFCKCSKENLCKSSRESFCISPVPIAASTPVRPRSSSLSSAESTESPPRSRASAKSSRRKSKEEQTKKSEKTYSIRVTRPGSAGSAKSAPSGQRTEKPFSKTTSSDSKVAKPRKNVKLKKSDIDPQSIQQLKDDLSVIKEQLFLLTKNRNNALELSGELHSRYSNLLQKNEQQEKEISALKQHNEMLLMKLKNQPIGEGPDYDDVVRTKKDLDQYQSKLNSLYSELVSSSKILEESRNHVCRCLEEKNNEFKSILNSTKRLSQTLEDKNGEYENLIESYRKAKENEEKLSKEKNDLLVTVKQLEDKLNQSVNDFENLKNETIRAEMKKREEIQNLNKSFNCQLEVKSQEVAQLNSTLKLLRSQNGDGNSMESEYKKLKKEYEQVMQKMRIFQETNNQRFQEVERLKLGEKKLLAQLTKLQNYSNELTEISNRQRLTITQLENMNHELEFAIQRLTAEMASKEKQIEILVKNEERLKKKTIDLQEEMISMRIQERNVLTTEEPALPITEELQDLITALYEEIDKTMAKDEQIQQLNRRICCLKCALSGKEQELIGVNNELKILRDQFASTLKEKSAFAQHLNARQKRLEKVCEVEECEC